MGFWDMLFGTDQILTNQDIAIDLLKDSKFTIISLAKAATATKNPQLRELYEAELMAAISQHHKLADLAASKDWYKPFLSPQNQIKEDLEASSIL